MFLGLRGVLAKAGSIAAGRPLLGCYGGGGQKPPSNLTNIERHQCGYLALKKAWYATRLIRLVATDISQDLLLKWWEPTTGKAWRTPRSSALLSV